MAQSGLPALPSVPQKWDISLSTASATGNINVGDWLAYSGQYVVATNSGHTAYWKTSGAGMALESNPVYDNAGRVIENSALKVMSQGIVLVSAGFSGQPTLGLGVYPISTGSGVASPTGATGVGATWQTAQVRTISALSGTANAQQAAVATVIGSQNFVNGGTGEILVRFAPLDPAVRG